MRPLLPTLVTLVCLTACDIAQSVGLAPREAGSPPEVVATAPGTGDTDIPLGAVLSVTFSEPMDKGTVLASLQFQPPLPCTFSWTPINNEVTCSPEGTLAPATRYQLQVTTAATDLEGKHLAREHALAFTTTSTRDTVPPRVLTLGQTGPASPVTRFVVEFSESMSAASTLSAFTITPSVACTFTWSGQHDRLECTPGSPLSPATPYLIQVSPAATDRSGNALDRAYTASFTTPPAAAAVAGVSPLRGATAVDRRAPLVLTFSAPVQRASVEAGLTVSTPSERVPGTFTWSDSSTLVTFAPAHPYPADASIGWMLMGASDATGSQLFAEGSFSTGG